MMLTQRHQQVNFADFRFGRAKREVGTVSKEAAAHNSEIVDTYNGRSGYRRNLGLLFDKIFNY